MRTHRRAVREAGVDHALHRRVVTGVTPAGDVHHVREPVERSRSGLIAVLVTRAEIELDGHRGWAMRMGDVRASTLAAAVCDAEVQRNGPLAAAVLALCELVAAEHAADRARRWAELEPTIVHFEELDA